MRASGTGGDVLGAQLKLVDAWLDGNVKPDALLVLAARDRGCPWRLHRAEDETGSIRWAEEPLLEPTLAGPGRDGDDAATLLAALLQREQSRRQKQRQERGQWRREPAAVQPQP